MSRGGLQIDQRDISPPELCSAKPESPQLPNKAWVDNPLPRRESEIES